MPSFFHLGNLAMTPGLLMLHCDGPLSLSRPLQVLHLVSDNGHLRLEPLVIRLERPSDLLEADIRVDLVRLILAQTLLQRLDVV